MFEKIINSIAFIFFIYEIKTVINYLKKKWFTFIDSNESYLKRLISFIILFFSLMLFVFLLNVSIATLNEWISFF